MSDLEKYRTRNPVVPWEPFFRLGNLARGKHPMRLGNHPDHHQRLGRGRFRPLIADFSPGAEIEASVPWLIAFAGGVFRGDPGDT